MRLMAFHGWNIAERMQSKEANTAREKLISSNIITSINQPWGFYSAAFVIPAEPVNGARVLTKKIIRLLYLNLQPEDQGFKVDKRRR